MHVRGVGRCPKSFAYKVVRKKKYIIDLDNLSIKKGVKNSAEAFFGPKYHDENLVGRRRQQPELSFQETGP